MELAGLLLTIVGTVATLAGTYVAVREYLRRRSVGPGPAAPPVAGPDEDGDGDGDEAAYDVFVAYGSGDAAWVRAFAGRLAARGVRVAYDELLARPGGVRVHTLERAIREAAHGLLVFGPGVWDDGWVRREYAALMRRSIENEAQRFVPVLVGDPDAPLELPEFAEVLYPADFRGVDEATYERLCEQISRVVREGPG
ncbi:toll/interleukin-1 receptor domain-containing protein [Streptomyces sp. 4N509B]|uniref:toll/interleukin-1 receptor domain-containing protein n=1 Tax=Streptomyces sp. 4N509B TaxID=3457413 RepID=UPI003FD28B21